MKQQTKYSIGTIDLSSCTRTRQKSYAESEKQASRSQHAHVHPLQSCASILCMASMLLILSRQRTWSFESTSDTIPVRRWQCTATRHRVFWPARDIPWYVARAIAYEGANIFVPCPGSKLAHFKQIHKTTGIPYSQMVSSCFSRRHEFAKTCISFFSMMSHVTRRWKN